MFIGMGMVAAFSKTNPLDGRRRIRSSLAGKRTGRRMGNHNSKIRIPRDQRLESPPFRARSGVFI
jgi:hypothetical protein